MLKSKITVLAFVLLLSGLVYAQSDQQKKPEAYKFAEFGKISAKEMRDKLRSFYAVLIGSPDLKGFIINYGPVAEIRERRDAIVKLALRCEDCRIIFVDGSAEPKVRTILWVAPPGADDPKL